jgi:hypothetical protein
MERMLSWLFQAEIRLPCCYSLCEVSVPKDLDNTSMCSELEYYMNHEQYKLVENIIIEARCDSITIFNDYKYNISGVDSSHKLQIKQGIVCILFIKLYQKCDYFY